MASAGLPLMTKAFTATPSFWAASFTAFAFFSALCISLSAISSRWFMVKSMSVGVASSAGTTAMTVSWLPFRLARPMASDTAADE